MERMCGIVVVTCAGKLEGWGRWYFVVVFRGRIWFSALEVMSCKEKRASIENQ
jgi:hypothetical protein